MEQDSEAVAPGSRSGRWVCPASEGWVWLGNWDSWATSLFPPLRIQKRGQAPVSGPAWKLGEGSPSTEGRLFQTFFMAEPFFQMQIYFPRTLIYK